MKKSKVIYAGCEALIFPQEGFRDYRLGSAGGRQTGHSFPQGGALETVIDGITASHSSAGADFEEPECAVEGQENTFSSDKNKAETPPGSRRPLSEEIIDFYSKNCLKFILMKFNKSKTL